MDSSQIEHYLDALGQKLAAMERSLLALFPHGGPN